MPEGSLLCLMIRYFPKEYVEIILTHVQKDGWNYQKVIEYMAHEVELMDPAPQRMSRWLAFKPSEATYQALQAWFPAWKQLLYSLQIDSRVVIHQFTGALHELFPQQSEI